jgi:predicted RNase H-like nuclease (RuvC/YqgF family)
MKRVIGVDPGKHGAIAVLDPATMQIVAVHKMPETDREVVELIRENLIGSSHVFVEQIPKFA